MSSIGLHSPSVLLPKCCGFRSSRLTGSQGTFRGALGVQISRSNTLQPTGSKKVMMNAAAAAVEAPKKAKPYTSYSIGDDLGLEYGIVGDAAPTHRRAGIILHPTSLPGPYGTGEIGQEAFRFIDWLHSAGCTAWQVLPLVPPEDIFWSPYSGLDALAGNTLLIDIEDLISRGLLDASDRPPTVPIGVADFPAVALTKKPLLTKAADRLLAADNGAFAELRTQLNAWRKAHKWVEDSALFSCLAKFDEETKDTAWWEWPLPIRKREKAALKAAIEKHEKDINRYIAEQFLFDLQWTAVKAYANGKGISIIGDMPIYVGGQSADVWANAHLFELSKDGVPQAVSGVPPDAFSETGQLWGSPLYDWKAHKTDRFRWWAQRLGRSFELYDETRIDHFRGFAGYWAVDAKEETAMAGVWRKGPGTELFEALRKQLGETKIIAEDLGVITPDVHSLREKIGAPGMVVLQFAWGGGPTNTHLPHNHYPNSVCYPGTHDNETSVGWWKDSATETDKGFLSAYIGPDAGNDIAYAFIREAFKSVSRTSIVMMQDVMRLDNSARMNFPGTTVDNWGWRIGGPEVWGTLDQEAADLKALIFVTDRSGDSSSD